MTNNNTYFVANWKMYGNSSSIKHIAKVISISKINKYKKVRIIYCPPYTLLEQFVKKTKKTNISIGAQNCHYEAGYGAFTGFVSTKMIKNSGCKFVIIGHSETRKEGDTDKKINMKIKSALDSNLKVIFCIGESYKDKKNKKTNLVLNNQIKNGLNKIKNLKNVLIAYEPVWSIGTGVIPKISNLNSQVKKIKKFINSKFKNKNVKVLYGGSVSSKNIKSLSRIKEIDGFLIGGASQNQNKFIDIIKKSIN